MEHSIIDFMFNAREASEEYVTADKNYRKASQKSVELYDKLAATLSEEQREVLDKFLDWQADEEGIKVEKTFKFGVKCGVRLVAECMFD